MYMMAKNKKSVNHKASRFRITGRLALSIRVPNEVMRDEEHPRSEHLRSGLEELVQGIHPLDELERDADQEQLL